MIEPAAGRGRQVWRDLALALVVKTIALITLYLLFFSQPLPVGQPKHLFAPSPTGSVR